MLSRRLLAGVQFHALHYPFPLIDMYAVAFRQSAVSGDTALGTAALSLHTCNKPSMIKEQGLGCGADGVCNSTR